MTTIADKDQPGPIGSTTTPTTSSSDPSVSLAGVTSTSSPANSSPPPPDLHHGSNSRASNNNIHNSPHLHQTSVHQHGSSSLNQKPPLSIEAGHEHTSLPSSSSSSRPHPGAKAGGPTDGSEPSGTGTDHGQTNGGDGMSPAVSTTSIMTSKSRSQQRPPQTFLTRALLSYLSIFRVVQPLVSLGAFGTITPVLTYFRNQTVFPAIQATLYVFTATLACCSLFVSVLYMVGVLYRKPLFWPFTNRHFRHSSKARIGGDMIVCMVFSGLWFLALVGLVIDTLWVDCGRLKGLERVFMENRVTEDRIKTVCQLEKATLGLSVICWACWVGVLLVLLYGHFWKRRQIIAERLRQRLSRGRTSRTRGGGAESAPAGVSSAVSGDGNGVASGSISGRLISSGSGTGGGGGGGDSGSLNESNLRHVVPQPSDDCGCQDMEGEVGLTGIICRYDDDQSSLGQGSKRDRPYSSVEA